MSSVIRTPAVAEEAEGAAQSANLAVCVVYGSHGFLSITDGSS